MRQEDLGGVGHACESCVRYHRSRRCFPGRCTGLRRVPGDGHLHRLGRTGCGHGRVTVVHDDLDLQPRQLVGQRYSSPSWCGTSPTLRRRTCYNDSVPAGDTKRYDNAAENLFGLSGVFGAIRVVADRSVVVNSRIYSTPAGKTDDLSAGQFFAAVPASFAIAYGQATQLLGVYQTRRPTTRCIATTSALSRRPGPPALGARDRARCRWDGARPPGLQHRRLRGPPVRRRLAVSVDLDRQRPAAGGSDLRGRKGGRLRLRSRQHLERSLNLRDVLRSRPARIDRRYRRSRFDPDRRWNRRQPARGSRAALSDLVGVGDVRDSWRDQRRRVERRQGGVYRRLRGRRGRPHSEPQLRLHRLAGWRRLRQQPEQRGGSRRVQHRLRTVGQLEVEPRRARHERVRDRRVGRAYGCRPDQSPRFTARPRAPRTTRLPFTESSRAPARASRSTAVRGESRSTTGVGSGVWGSHAGSGAGVFGSSENGYGRRRLSARPGTASSELPA